MQRPLVSDSEHARLKVKADRFAKLFARLAKEERERQTQAVRFLTELRGTDETTAAPTKG